MKTLKFFALIWLVISLVARTSFAQAGNDNPTGVAGFFNGNVTTGGSYDPYTGNATRSVTDLVVPGSGGAYPLAFTRTANSRYTPGLPVEFAEPGGWRHSYQWSIDSQSIRGSRTAMPSGYTVNFPGGRREIFRTSGSDIYMRASPGVRERFQKSTSSGGGYCYLILPDGGKIWFNMIVDRLYPPDDGAGQTESTFDFEFLGIIDPHGLVTTVTHPGDGSRQITEPGGRWLKLFYGTSTVGQRERVLYRVTASDGRTVEYQYWEYTTSTNVKFSAFTHVFYNLGPEWATYSYQDDNMDPSGRPLLKTCEDPMFPGAMWKIGYTFAPSGPGVVAGQLQSENYSPASNSVGIPVSTLTVDHNNPSMRTETRGDGPARTLGYLGPKLVSETDFKNMGASQTHDSAGFVNSATDRRGNTTNFVADPLTGNIKTTTFPLTPPDAQRAATQVAYGGAACPDQNNRDGNNPYFVCTVTNERGYTTKYFRDANKRVIRVEYPDGGVETFDYNHFGQVITHGMTSGGTEKFEYDNTNGRLLAYRDPYHLINNPTARFQYDNRGRVSGVTDARGTSNGDPNHTTNYEYDFRGQVTKITHPIEPGTSLRYFVQNQYNPNGTLKTTMNERGHTTAYAYDDYKRLSSVTASLAYAGDPTPRITAIYYTRNGSAGVYDYSHTDASPGGVVSPGGKYVRTLYDDNVRKKTVMVGLGNEEAKTTYTYDAVGNLETVTDPAGQTTGLYTKYFYDARNRLTDANNPIASDRNNRGYTVSCIYDPAGNKKSEQRANNQLITYDEYDPLNRLKQQSVQRDAGITDTTRMTYDFAGNLRTFQDGRAKTYTYGYDLMNRRESLTYPPDGTEAVRQEVYHYDIANNMDTYTDRSGAVQTFEYDNRNRQTHYWWNTWREHTMHERWLSYDPVGNVTRVRTEGEDISDVVYDWRNRKTSDTQTPAGRPARTIGYTYDADSNRRTMTYPSGYILTYDYNSRNQLRSESDAAGAVVTYDYWPNDVNLRTRTFRNGTATTYTPDALSRPKAVAHSRGGTSLGRFDYRYDSVSRVKSVKRDFNRGDAYGYYLDDQLKNVQYDAFNVDLDSPWGSTNSTSLVYDASGNRTSQTNTASPSYAYGVNNLNQYNAVNSLTPEYDFVGNLFYYDGWEYEYNRQNQLTDAESGTQVLYFYYDGLNRQILRYVNGQWIYSAWDGWNLLEEYDINGQVIHSYVHGAATDEMVQRFDPGPNPNRIWYYQDAQGSTTHLADDAGTVVEKYKYDPAFSGAPSIYDGNGNPRANSFYDNRFLYTGREYYKEGAIYDYRNRFYLPSLGRFLQPDPIGFAGDSSNLYRYCGGDPVNNTDPTGETRVYNPRGGYFTYWMNPGPPTLTGGYAGGPPGHCGVGCQAVSGAPHTRYWYQGAPVGSTTMPFTVIVAGWQGGRYPSLNPTEYRAEYGANATVNHVAIFLGYVANKPGWIWVVDQFIGKGWGRNQVPASEFSEVRVRAADEVAHGGSAGGGRGASGPMYTVPSLAAGVAGAIGALNAYGQAHGPGIGIVTVTDNQGTRVVATGVVGERPTFGAYGSMTPAAAAWEASWGNGSAWGLGPGGHSDSVLNARGRY